MKWYDILIEDEFINYFSDETNTFYTEENGEKVLAPLFKKFQDIVLGITNARFLIECNLNEDRMKQALENMQEVVPDMYLGCHYYLSTYTKEDRAFTAIWQTIPHVEKMGHYCLRPEYLSCEQIAVLIMYPFWSRMGGSFEINFLDRGDLKYYLLGLKERREYEKAAGR